MLGNGFFEPSKLDATETMRRGQGYGIKPEFRNGARLLDVDVRRFLSLIGVEEESC